MSNAGHPYFSFSSLVQHFSEVWSLKKLLLSFLFPSPKLMCERRESVDWPDKDMMLSHFSRSHEHFVIICLVLHSQPEV